MAKFLVFAPYAAIWQHSFPEATLLETLVQQGHHVVYLTCDGLLVRYCAAMSAFGCSPLSSDDEKKAICTKCNLAKKAISDEFSFQFEGLEKFLTPENHAIAQSAIAVLNKDNAYDFEFENIPVGILASYEFLIKRKKFNREMSQSDLEDFIPYLINSLLALQAMKKILNKFGAEHFVVYNSLYSVNAVCAEVCRRAGLQIHSLHAGKNLSRFHDSMMICRDTTLNHLRQLKTTWDASASIRACTEAEIRAVGRHYREQFTGRSAFVYSLPSKRAKKDIRGIFGIKTEQRLIVATLSSYDERFSAEFVGASSHPTHLLFETQVDWVQALIDHAKTRPDLAMVIRVHPREFPNKRESVRSDHSIALQNALRVLPENVCINWPDQGLSIYDFAEHADVFLNAWSSVGVDMPLFGVPVVIYSSELTEYPPELNFVGESLKDYFLKIDEALNSGWSFDRVLCAFRWQAQCLELTSFDLSAAVRVGPGSRTFLWRGVRKLGRSMVPKLQYAFDLKTRRRLPAAKAIEQTFLSSFEKSLEPRREMRGPTLSPEAEKAIVARELKRIFVALYGPIKDRASVETSGNTLSKSLNGFFSSDTFKKLESLEV